MRARYRDKAQERHDFVYKGALRFPLSGRRFHTSAVIKTASLLSERLETVECGQEGKRMGKVFILGTKCRFF